MSELNRDKAKKAASSLLKSLGVDLSDPNYKGTPQRMVEVFVEFTSSLHKESKSELEEYFGTLFPKHNGTKAQYKGMLVQSPIRVYSLCSHHMLPVIYDIAFAYIPKKGEQIGFSKIVRILRHIARRPMNQEGFTQEAVDLFYKKLKPQGLAIVVSGVHLCMKMRGVQSEAVNKTSAVKGDFKDYECTRDEFLALAANFNHLPVSQKTLKRIIERGAKFYELFGWTKKQIRERSEIIASSEALVGNTIRYTMPNSIMVYTPTMLERAQVYSGQKFETDPLPIIFPKHNE